MRELKPQARRAAVLANLSSSIPKLELGFAKQFASVSDFDITLYDAHEVDELKRVLTNIPQSNPDVLVVLNDPFVFTYRKLIVEAVNQQQLPGIYGFREFVDDGGLISYGTAIIQLVYYRGLAECRASSWIADPDRLAAVMSRIDCRGGHTQIAKVLAHAGRENESGKVAVLVFVGDAMEESLDERAERDR